MNIFVLDESPLIAAQMLCDCHIRKMCVETAQILSGVMLRRGIALREGMPNPQNLNHPVIVAAEVQSGLNWLFECNFLLHREYSFRFGKEHKYSKFAAAYQWNIGFTLKIDCATLAKCCGGLDVSGLDIVSAYRKYYLEVKKPALQAKGLWHFTSRKDWTI